MVEMRWVGIMSSRLKKSTLVMSAVPEEAIKASSVDTNAASVLTTKQAAVRDC